MAKRVRVVFVAAHDSVGGAARAAHRVFQALRRFESDRVDIVFRVIHKTHDDNDIIGGKPRRSRLEYAEYWLRTRFRKYVPRKPFVTTNPVLHSQALYPSGLGREINRMNPDVVLCGWLGGSTLSIREIGSLRAPIVWRLSDLWVVAGAEHLTEHPRYAEGYSKASRPADESGPDINRETFLRKKKYWKRPGFIVALSRWQQRQAAISTLTSSWPSTVIPVPIDPDAWSPVDKVEARQRLGLPLDALLVVFGAGAATKHRHKGADLLFDALPTAKEALSRSRPGKSVELVIFGEEEDQESLQTGVTTHFLGKLGNDELRLVYSAADVVVAPSRQESFGQVAAEAQTCGAPIVVFDNSGLADVVDDRVTGRLVPAFDTEKLGEAIAWVLGDETRLAELGQQARTRAIKLWHPKVIAKHYADVLVSVAANPPR